jgi:hypothetical protein
MLLEPGDDLREWPNCVVVQLADRVVELLLQASGELSWGLRGEFVDPVS